MTPGGDVTVRYLQGLLLLLQNFEEAGMDGIDSLSLTELKKYVSLTEVSVLRVLAEHSYAQNELRPAGKSSVH